MSDSRQDSSAAGHSSLAALIEINLYSMNQVLALLSRISENAYSVPPAGFPAYRVGAHVRHIVDFYHCFFKGLETRRIDYNARSRDRQIETSRAKASAAITNIIASFDSCRRLRGNDSLLVIPEDGEDGLPEHLLRSSVSRELQALSSHTIHHFALIALILRLHGLAVDPAFGMAPSTLRYLASEAKESKESREAA